MGEAKKTGTREWSEHSFNCVKGCGHGCLYCYARAGRFNTKRGVDWQREELCFPKVRRFKGVVMFPTRHDFTPETTLHCLKYLQELLQAGNNVLVVTKTGTGTVGRIVDVLAQFPKTQSEIRFTLSHLKPSIGWFWEPGAPTIGYRMEGLVHAHDHGVRTSVSCEPWLDDLDSLIVLVGAVSPSVTETIWIGHANKLQERTAWLWKPGTPFDDDQKADLHDAITAIRSRQTPEAAKTVYEALKGNPKVRWKDSYQQILDLSGPESHP